MKKLTTKRLIAIALVIVTLISLIAIISDVSVKNMTVNEYLGKHGFSKKLESWQVNYDKQVTVVINDGSLQSWKGAAGSGSVEEFSFRYGTIYVFSSHSIGYARRLAKKLNKCSGSGL